MICRPWLIMKVRESTPQEWFGRPLRQVLDADVARWYAVKRAAGRLLAS